MPRLKQREGPYDKLLRLLKAYDMGTGAGLAAVLKCSEGTGRNRLGNPGDLTLDELKKINRAGVPIEDIRAAI